MKLENIMLNELMQTVKEISDVTIFALYKSNSQNQNDGYQRRGVEKMRKWCQTGQTFSFKMN